MTDINKIAVLILAAGKSLRFGSPKQLAIWQGITLIEHAIKTAAEAGFKNIYISLNPAHSDIAKKLKPYPIKVILSENSLLGMGSTISDSVRKIISEKKKYESCLILLSDQPLMTSKHLRELAKNNKKGECTFTKYKNTEGTPAIFSNYYFDKLELLKGESGAKSLINKLNPKYELYDSEFFDIDYQEDYQKLITKEGIN
jgi:molybdenum cofactor cytidylyltransferase